MGDGTAQSRIVAGPAAKATGYGLAAALGSASRVLGEAMQEAARVVDAITNIIDFWHRAHAAPVPPHVAYARRLWLSEIVPRNKLFAPVLLLDVGWFTKEAHALTKNSAFLDLAKTEFGAWTNSSTSILIYPGFEGETDLTPVDVALRKVILSHEANHVLEFLVNGDRPPLTYHEMAVFETKAYTVTVAELDKLAADNPALAGDEGFAENRLFFGFLQNWFANVASLPATPETDKLIRQRMIDWKNHRQESSPLLPAAAGETPMNLYLR